MVICHLWAHREEQLFLLFRCPIFYKYLQKRRKSCFSPWAQRWQLTIFTYCKSLVVLYNIFKAHELSDLGSTSKFMLLYRKKCEFSVWFWAPGPCLGIGFASAYSGYRQNSTIFEKFTLSIAKYKKNTTNFGVCDLWMKWVTQKSIKYI